VQYRPTVPALLRAAIDAHGDSDYVVLPDDRLTFRVAERRSAALALRLLEAGAGKGTRIGIFLPTGTDWVVAWLAAARIGALSMLLPATYRPAELRRTLAIGDVAILFAPRTMLGKDCEAFLEDAVPSLSGHDGGPIQDLDVPYLRSIWMTGDSSKPWATPVDLAVDSPPADAFLRAVEAAVSPADPLLVIYTSGSAADPKAIVHTHGAAIRKIQPELAMCLPASFPGRTFCAMPFFWVGGPQELLGALHSGAAVVTQPRFAVREALELLERERCTSIMGWANILDQLKSDPTYPMRRLADLTLPIAARSSQGHPRNLGMTETFGPHANPDWFEYKVIDPVDGTILEPGQEGEFCVRGFGLMAGMYKKEREEVFGPDGWYHTGDRGYVEDGTIWFTGRYSEMIKSGGANVSPLEVERVLEGQPGVAVALVLGVTDPDRGQAVAAVVVPDAGAELDPIELRERTNRELSAYKVPSRWLVLQPEEVPFLPSGKPDKRTLRDRF
jgi:acyl-CoA synthetase (AMP-forming)/AMP-acid ligase II